MATHFSILPWVIISTEEPGGLQSMGLRKSLIELRGIYHVHGSEESIC